MALALYLVTSVAIGCLHPEARRRRVPLAVLVLLPMLFTGRALLTGRVYAPIDLPFSYEPLASQAAALGVVTPHDIALSDLHCQMIPWQKAVRYALARGEWPLWNPFILCGDILAAAAQPAVYDPFNLLALILPIPQALTFGASITFFLAGFFTWAFAREIGRSEIASLIAAAAFMFCGMMAFFVAWPLGRSWAFLPLILFGVRRVVQKAKAGVLLAAFVLLIVAGHPESVLHVVAVGVVYGLFELFGKFRWRTIAYAAAAGIIALALTAIYLLPFHEASTQTLEHDIRRALYAPATYEHLAPPETRAHRIGRTFLPFFDGQPWRGTTNPRWDPLSARAGSLVLALALAALVTAPRRSETWFFFGLGLVCLGATFGTWPFAHLLHELPLFDIAINERLAFAAAFAMAMLAAIAVDTLRRSTALVLLATATALAIAAYVTNVRTLMLAELLPIMVVAIWTAAAKPPLSKAAALLPQSILILILLQRAYVDGSIYPSLPEKIFYPPLHGIPKEGRIVGVGHTLVPNAAAMYELEDVRGYEAMTFKRLTDTYALWSKFQVAWFNIVDDASKPFLSFLNVRYVLDGTRVTENTAALPRAFVPRRIRYERDGKNVIESMKQATDFSDVAWIETAAYEPHDAPNGPGSVAIHRDGFAWDLDADMQGAGWIVMSETAWKGWRAYIDGRRVGTQFANHAFLGIHVPPGRHRVRLVYLPESFTRGRNISAITLLLLGICAIVRRVCRRSSSISS